MVMIGLDGGNRKKGLRGSIRSIRSRGWEFSSADVGVGFITNHQRRRGLGGF